MLTLMLMVLITHYSYAAINPETMELLLLLDETSGTVAKDSSMHGRHGELVGESEWVPGHFAGGYQPNGVDGLIAITDWKGIEGNQERSTVLWYKTESATDERLVTWGSAGQGNRYIIRVQQDLGTLRVQTQGGQLYANDPIIADGQWHHLAVLLPPDSTTCHAHLLYVDGVLVTDLAGADGPINTVVTEHDVEIGWNRSSGNGGHASGTFDEVAIFSVALSEADINDIMNNGLAPRLKVAPTEKLPTFWGALKSR